MTRIRAVTFDAGGTLIEPWPSVGGVYAQVAAEFGLSCDAETLNRGFGQAWRGRSDFNYTRAEWFEVYAKVLPNSANRARLFLTRSTNASLKSAAGEFTTMCGPR